MTKKYYWPKASFSIDKIQFKDEDIPVYWIQYRQHTPNLVYCASVSHLMRQVLLEVSPLVVAVAQLVQEVIQCSAQIHQVEEALVFIRVVMELVTVVKLEE